MDTLYLGPVPPEEDCVQVGDEGYELRAREQCQRYIDLIRRVMGKEPEGARLYIKTNYHDLGSYLEVCVDFDPSSKEATKYAFTVECDGPYNWEGDR